MKNISTILSSLSLVGVIVLFVIFFQDNNKNILEEEIIIDEISTDSVILSTGVFAFIDVQRITNEYGYYQEIVVELEAKQKRAESKFRNKAQAFQEEYEAYMKKAQMGAFLSQQSQQQQEQQLMQKQESLKVLEQELSMKLQGDMQKLDAQATDTIMNSLKAFNKIAKYDLIFNSATILDKGAAIDVTDTILSILNTRYEKQKVQK